MSVLSYLPKHCQNGHWTIRKNFYKNAYNICDNCRLRIAVNETNKKILEDRVPYKKRDPYYDDTL